MVLYIITNKKLQIKMKKNSIRMNKIAQKNKKNKKSIVKYPSHETKNITI